MVVGPDRAPIKILHISDAELSSPLPPGHRLL